MEEFQRVDDLYIKMNARGKLLSDFEIFKAKLQETTILKRLLGENCSLQDQIDYISKYNNEFTEYFYKYFKGDSTDAESIDESIKDFDSAMMDFVKSIARDDYFVYLKESEIGQKQYRDDYRLIPNMNGNVFSRFVEKGKFEREGAEVIYSKLSNPEDAITQSLVKVYALLNAFCNRANLSVDTVFTKKYYDETALFISMAGKDNLPENVIRYGLFSLLYKLGYPNGIDETKAYDCWKRFIYNLVNNSDVRNSEYAVEAMWILKCHIDAISKYDEKEILKVISECNETCASLRDQLKEERIKATLMQSGTDWYDLLLDAEEYFVDGQVGFLLDYSEMADGTYDIDQFKKYYAVAKSFFDCNKKINSNLDWKLFETALLCVDDLSGNNSAHLEKMKNSSTTWGFFEGKYAEYLKNSNEGQHNQKRKMLQLLWDKMGTGTIDDELSSIVTTYANTPLTDESEWKHFFANDSELYDAPIDDNGEKFQNCIHLYRRDNGKYDVLMLIGTTVRSYSMELNTFLLYKELIASYDGIGLHLDTRGDIMETDASGVTFTRRYLTYKDNRIGYSLATKDPSKPYILRSGQIVVELDKAELLTKLSSL